MLRCGIVTASNPAKMPARHSHLAVRSQTWAARYEPPFRTGDVMYQHIKVPAGEKITVMGVENDGVLLVVPKDPPEGVIIEND